MMCQFTRFVMLSLGVVALMSGTASAEGFRPDRLLLTWQQDPTSTMTVQWLQSGEALPVVEEMVTERDPHALPHIGEVAIDASGDDWWDRGLPLTYLANDSHGLPPADVLDAEVRLGWNAQGLVVLGRVNDPEPWEHPELERLWDGDSLELFVSDGVGSDYRYQAIVSPGRGDEPARHIFYEKSGGPAEEELEIEYAARETDAGYVVEVLMPWSSLPAFEAAEGAELGFQIYVNRRDGEGEGFRWVGLHPARDASANANAKYPFYLAAEAGPAIRTRAAMERDDDDQAVARLYGNAALAGEPVRLLAGDRELSATRFEAEGRRGVAEMAVPAPPEERRWGLLEARLENERLMWVDPPAWQGYLEPEAATVAYWPRGENEDQAAHVTTEVRPVEDWPGKFRQRVELTGLGADTHYRFRADDYEHAYGFRTMPEALTRPVRFAAGGDARHDQEWLTRTNRVALSYDIDFVLWGGDLAYADGLQQQLYRWEEWFEGNHDGLIDEDRRVVPIVVAIGNHEVQSGYYDRHDGYEPTDAWRQRIAPYFYQLFAFPGQPGYASLDFGDYLSILALDSAHSNPIPGAQTEWLEQALAERQHRPHVFPVYHVPAYPSHRDPAGRVETQVRDYWVPLFEEYGIRVAFENHDHTYKRTHPIRGGEVASDGVVYIGDGAWGVSTRAGNHQDEWYISRFASERHAIIVTLDGPHQHYLTVNEHGEVIDEYPQTPRSPEADVTRPNADP